MENKEYKCNCRKPPLTKEEFIAEIEFLYKINEAATKFDDVVGLFCDDHIAFVGDNFIVHNLDLLRKLFHDEESDWLGYYVYTLEWGKAYKPGDITETVNGEMVDYDLSTPEKLYNFLIECKFNK